MYASIIYIFVYISTKKHNLLKPQIFPFFSESLSMCNQNTKETTDNSAT